MKTSVPSHEQWMELCQAGAQIFQRCSRRAYYSVILSPSGRVLGTGYNGSPSGVPNCTDGGCPRSVSEVAHGSSYGNCTAVHAEANALLHSDRSARDGGTLYVNGPPCWECSKLIAGSGIKTVVHTRDLAYAEWPKCQALLESVGINVVSIGASFNQSRDLGSAVRLRAASTVDLASGPSYRRALVDPDCNFKALGYGPSERCNDGPDHVQSNP